MESVLLQDFNWLSVNSVFFILIVCVVVINRIHTLLLSRF